MAIYHLSVQNLSRGKGRSALAAAAYRAAEQLHDERLGLTHNYSKKLGVEHKEILAPADSPAWVFDRERLWNEVEKAEKRKDARLAREVQVALPKELSKDEQVALVRDFVRGQFVDKGMVADFAIHRDNPENPHAHILLTTREMSVDGFGKKNREWNQKDALLEWRAEWAQAVNLSLERAGVQERVDHRSYAEQGVAIEPTVKLGVRPEEAQKDGRDFIHRRMEEHDRIVRQNGEAIADNPLIALDAITRQRATFTRSDVGRFLNSRTADAEQFQTCLNGVMASSEVIKLGKDDRGNERFTTREMLDVEYKMLGAAEEMAQRRSHVVRQETVKKVERWATLSGEQRAAIGHVTAFTGGLAVIEGYAGTGKSYGLGVAREAWEAEGYRVRGAALAGKAAEGLEVGSGIASRSLHAWEYAWKQGREQLTGKDVLVIDEAGMVGSRQLQRVLEHARQAQAKVVLVGDTEQLQAIEAGAPMRAIAERVGHVTLGDIRRQRETWQRYASFHMAEGRTAKGLDAYAERGFVRRHDSRQDAMQSIMSAWDEHRKAAPDKQQIILAFRREEVRALNQSARMMRQRDGELGEDHRIETARGARDFAVGDRVYFLKNDRFLEVKNGTLGTVEGIKDGVMAVRLDGEERRTVTFDTRSYNNIDHGYAATVHKAQGVTVDRAHVLASDLFDRHVAYVAMSRHRDGVELHWSRDMFRDEAHMRQALCRERRQDLALDYREALQHNRELKSEREVRVSWEREPAPQEREAPRPAEGRAEKRETAREPEQAPQPSPREVIRQYAQVERLAEQKPVTAKDMLEQQPGVREPFGAYRSAKGNYEWWKGQVDFFAERHPVKAQMAKVGLGAEADQYRQMVRAHERLVEARDALTKVWDDPARQKQAKLDAVERNARIEKARESLPKMKPALEAAKEQLARERAERAKEIKKQRDMSRSRSRDLGWGR